VFNYFSSGRLAHHVVFSLWIVRVMGTWWTAVGRLYFWIWGLRLGNRCQFFGYPIIRRYPQSVIEIGGRCLFASTSRFNAIGINHPCVISTHHAHSRIQIGNGCGFSGTTIGCGLSIRIGDGVRCGANTVITDTDWHTDDPRTRSDAPIVIEDGVWLGLNVTVLKGVTIGRGSFVASGSVVTRSVPAYSVAAGVPARVIRCLET